MPERDAGAPPAICVRGLSYAYEGEDEVLKDVAFTVSQGETIVLVGLSGCGKTTLCRCLAGLAPKALGGMLRGSVHILGQDIAELPLAHLATRVGFVFQDPDNQMVTTTVEDELAFGPENLAVDPAEIRGRVDDGLRRYRASHLALRSPNSLSGGEKRLVAIAAVLALDPPVVILDEPFAHLDERGRDTVRDVVLELRRKGRTLIIVEHDISRTAFADRYLLIEDGRLACTTSSPPRAYLDPVPADVESVGGRTV